MRIFKEFRIEVAHFLPNVPDGHKCRRLHGHSIKVEIHVSGDPDEASGWICDFADINAAWQPVHDALDHRLLNDTIANPTSENLAKWIWCDISARLPSLSMVVVRETCTSGCVYAGPGA